MFKLPEKRQAVSLLISYGSPIDSVEHRDIAESLTANKLNAHLCKQRERA